MKNLILSFLAVCACGLAATSCGKPELKNVRGLVTDVEIVSDSLKSKRMTVGSDTLLFSMRDCMLNNGIMLRGDSVIVDYIDGRGDSLRALVLTLLPKPAHYVNPADMAGDSLLTAPAAKEEAADAAQ